MRNYSATSRRGMNATSGAAPVMLVEIDHPDLAAPIRVAQDTADVACQGNTYVAFAFDIDLPDDMDRQAPRARIAIDNAGRELTQWLEASNGGEGATARIMSVQRADPDVIEWEATLNLSDVEMDLHRVSGSLGYEDLLSKPGVALSYRPDTAPGIF